MASLTAGPKLAFRAGGQDYSDDKATQNAPRVEVGQLWG